MDCIAPDEISEEQLVAYADGEADDTTLDHVRRCRYCAERGRILASEQAALRALFQRAECPDAHTLGEFHLGFLSSAEQAAIQDHLQACSKCSAELDTLNRFLREAPAVPTLPQIPPKLKRLVAQLAPQASGLGTQQPTLAFRGAAAHPLDFYQAEDIRVVVGLEADGLRAGRKMLLGFTARQGQPLESLSGAYVQLSHRGETLALEQVDTLGNFVFSDLSSGEYELMLVTDKEQVVIETIVI